MNEIFFKPDPLELRVAHVIKVGMCIDDWNLFRHFKDLSRLPSGTRLSYWEKKSLRRAFNMNFIENRGDLYEGQIFELAGAGH